MSHQWSREPLRVHLSASVAVLGQESQPWLAKQTKTVLQLLRETLEQAGQTGGPESRRKEQESGPRPWRRARTGWTSAVAAIALVEEAGARSGRPVAGEQVQGHSSAQQRVVECAEPGVFAEPVAEKPGARAGGFERIGWAGLETGPGMEEARTWIFAAIVGLASETAKAVEGRRASGREGWPREQRRWWYEGAVAGAAGIAGNAAVEE